MMMKFDPDLVPPKILKAAQTASEGLRRLRIPHVICGGMAVGLYAEPRMTKDVDFIVPDDALAKIGGKPLSLSVVGVTHDVGDVAVDFISAASWPRYEQAIERALERPVMVEGLPMATLGTICWTKLGQRQKDTADLTEIAKRQDMTQVLRWLQRNDPEGAEDLESIITVAEWEKGGMRGGRRANPGRLRR